MSTFTEKARHLPAPNIGPKAKNRTARIAKRMKVEGFMVESAG
jgi:hypothetical protein